MRCMESGVWGQGRDDGGLVRVAVLGLHEFNTRGADQARAYVTKYCAKAERHFYTEGENNSTKQWLKARIMGACTAMNRLLGFHTMRKTKPVEKTTSDVCAGSRLRGFAI